MKFTTLLLIIISFLLVGYTFTNNNVHLSRLSSVDIVDKDATYETKALYYNLKQLSNDKVLFGHQDALAYGVQWGEWHKKRSDVKDVCGKYPAVFGWEMSKLGKWDYNIDTVNFEHMKGWIKEAYKMGGLNTMSWHFDNFSNKGTSWDVQDSLRVVASILPGGENHKDYVEKLDHFAEFIKELKVGFFRKKSIPIVFRPFHEHTGEWFWWGAPYCTPEEYRQLWRFTVEYLRDEKNLHNLLYAYSPDIFKDEAHYLEYYPGDDLVDIIGLDDYHDVGSSGDINDLTRRLVTIVKLAEEKNKVAALTETGYETIPDEGWWTDTLLGGISQHPEAKKIAWVMVWRNDRKEHHYAPYPSHSSAPNFIEFSNNPLLLFADDVTNLYKIPKN